MLKPLKIMSKKIEEWRPIQGYEGLYEVSDWGRVKSVDRIITRKNGRKLPFKEKILKGGKNNMGYLLVCLNKDGKETWKLVHRLVAEAFLPNPQNLPQVNHKDETPTNNHVENLEWCTAKYNTNYGTGIQRMTKKLLNRQDKSKRVDQIDAQTGEVIYKWTSTREAERNGYNSTSVAACARGERKTHKGYVWKYLQA